MKNIALLLFLVVMTGCGSVEELVKGDDSPISLSMGLETEEEKFERLKEESEAKRLRGDMEDSIFPKSKKEKEAEAKRKEEVAAKHKKLEQFAYEELTEDREEGTVIIGNALPAPEDEPFDEGKITFEEAQALVDSGIMIEYNPQNHESVFGKPYMLYFHSEYCPTCIQLEKNIQNAAQNFAEGTKILTIDYDKESALRKQHKVRLQNTLIGFDAEGVEIFREVSPKLTTVQSFFDQK